MAKETAKPEPDIFEKPPVAALNARQLSALIARVKGGELTLQKGSNPEKFFFGKAAGKGVQRVAVVCDRGALSTHRVDLETLAK